MKRAPLGKADPEPMEEEADTDEEEGRFLSIICYYSPKIIVLSEDPGMKSS